MSGSPKARRAAALLEAAAARNVALAALGGVAIERLCPSARPGGRWAREPADIDVATTLADKAGADRLILEHGFAADAPFNRMNGSTRLRYLDEDGTHLDVFVDELRLCHVVAWRRALTAGQATLPLSALLLTKLQIVVLEPKDTSDLSALLSDAWEPLLADWDRIEPAVARDWGLWRTARGNLERLAGSPDALVAGRAHELTERWDGVEHKGKARVRALVGDRMRWYEEPEEV
jgi:hypothetical protein